MASYLGRANKNFEILYKGLTKILINHDSPHL